MISLGSGKIKDLRLGSEKISKAYLGDRLVFYKGGGIVETSNSLTFYTTTRISPFASQINISKEIANKLYRKTNLKLKIEDFQEIVVTRVYQDAIWLKKSIDEATGNTDWIEIGTKIVVTFD